MITLIKLSNSVKVVNSDNNTTVYLKSTYGLVADPDKIRINLPSGDGFNIPLALLDKANCIPAITGTTPEEIATELQANFFFEGFNIAQQQIESGYRYSLQENDGSPYANSANLPADTAVAIPILVEKPITFDLLQIHVVGAFTGASLLGAIYNTGSQGTAGDLVVPKTKLFDLAELTTELETTGTKTVDSTLRTLQPGLYWWVYLRDTGGQVRLRGKSSNNSKPYLASGFSGVASAPINHMEQARLHADGLPDEWTTAWTNKVNSAFTLPYLWFSKS